MQNHIPKNDNFQLPEAAAQSVLGKRLAFLYIKSGDDNRIWPKQLITDTLKKASENMLFASWCSRGDANIGKMTWVTAIVSNMDSPNNSYGSGKNKTAFQGGMRECHYWGQKYKKNLHLVFQSISIVFLNKGV